ncbi:ABC transporter substrate-binding protein [Algibacter sp. L1A34]|uniref:ABC transporter substrate-binding protein n=1 Tax=Algibacter sp. L1A34 TaxID=2686365 RepID=UPI00131E21E6|nr:ABC transporter substrate-binding protein [Algibacter sp. L1A34]
MSLLLQKKYLSFSLFFILISFISCKKEKETTNNITTGKEIKLKYAKGFSIKDLGMYKTLEIKTPWPNAESSFRYVLANYGDNKQADNTISLPIKKIVVTSTTHLPALELLGVEQTLVGFPGTKYISSKKIRSRVDNGDIRELGKNEGINTEVLLELDPDLVVGFGIDGNNKSLDLIEKAGIPVIYNGDWVETSPLAKAEWIKFFGVLYNKEKEADSIFNTIEKEYLNAKKIAKNVKNKPTVLSGAMHNDIWYLPNGTSTEAQLLRDANTSYLWNDSKGTGSLQLNFESVFMKAQNADIWLSPSNYSSLEKLKNASAHNAEFKAFKDKNIYSFNNTTGDTGGVLYFELGMSRPDLVLKDLIKICHPELLPDYNLYFFERLE